MPARVGFGFFVLVFVLLFLFCWRRGGEGEARKAGNLRAFSLRGVGGRKLGGWRELSKTMCSGGGGEGSKKRKKADLKILTQMGSSQDEGGGGEGSSTGSESEGDNKRGQSQKPWWRSRGGGVEGRGGRLDWFALSSLGPAALFIGAGVRGCLRCDTIRLRCHAPLFFCFGVCCSFRDASKRKGCKCVRVGLGVGGGWMDGEGSRRESPEGTGRAAIHGQPRRCLFFFFFRC